VISNKFEQNKLEIGLAEVFGRLKTKEAIPFLIENISLERLPPRPNIWMKTWRALASILSVSERCCVSITGSSSRVVASQTKLFAINEGRSFTVDRPMPDALALHMGIKPKT
jgi:hypothetical protein